MAKSNKTKSETQKTQELISKLKQIQLDLEQDFTGSS
jgi:hypothetical protein